MGILEKISKKDATVKTKKVKSTKGVVELKDDKKSSSKKGSATLFAYDIIRQPISTEKSDRAQMIGKYTFFVTPKTGKVEIARAIKELYGVKPISVRIINTLGKKVRAGRSQGKRSDRKKAIITLKQGDSIKIAE